MPDEPLPGLELAPANLSPLVRALRRSIADLDSRDLLGEGHALELAAAHLLARSAEMKLATGRASTIANDVDLLLRIKQTIAEPTEGAGVDEEIRELLEKFNQQLDEEASAGP